MKVLVRVDAYDEIALGHLSRCIELGKELVDLNNKVIFLCYEDDSAKARLKDSKAKFKLLPFKINEDKFLEDEIQILESYSESIDILILDSYNVDRAYFKLLNHFFPVIIYLDDIKSDFEYVDMVINPSCKVTNNNYMAKNVLHGIEFLILGKDYLNPKPRPVNSNISSIIITMGGIDHFNISSRVLPILEEINDNIEVNLIIGPYYENTDQIKKAASESNLTVNFFEGLTNISSVIMQSDIAISAGGFTLYELCSMSTPTIGISLWDNQKNNVDCLAEKGALIPLYYSSKYFDSELETELRRLIENLELRKKISKASKEVISGNGAKKIAKEIVKIYE